jgi:hypothetical protein
VLAGIGVDHDPVEVVGRLEVRPILQQALDAPPVAHQHLPPTTENTVL